MNPVASRFGLSVSNPYRKNADVRDRLSQAYTRLSETKNRLFPISANYDGLVRDLETLKRTLERTKNLVDEHVSAGQRVSSWTILKPVPESTKDSITDGSSTSSPSEQKKTKSVNDMLSEEIQKLANLHDTIDALIHDLQSKQTGSVRAAVDHANVLSGSSIFNTGVTSTFTELPQISPSLHLELGGCVRYRRLS